jgi:hypothetical protein
MYPRIPPLPLLCFVVGMIAPGPNRTLQLSLHGQISEKAARSYHVALCISYAKN